MNLIHSLMRIFTNFAGENTINYFDRFNNASIAFQNVHKDAESYTLRGNNRLEIRMAIRKLDKSELTDNKASANYDATVAEFKDPADFEDYNVVYLDAHTAVIENVDRAFEELSSAFEALNKKSKLYSVAVGLYGSHAEYLSLTIGGYLDAAKCAHMAALEGKVQCARDDFEVAILEGLAAKATGIDAFERQEKAVAFKEMNQANLVSFELLEARAILAKEKAKSFQFRVTVAIESCER